ncbi:MAG: IS4 family transposase [Saprospiraceae bacterium]
MGLFRRSKNTTTPVFKQIIDLIPKWLITQSVKKHQSDKGTHKYKTYDQLVALTFGQLNKCFTLSDISMGIGLSRTFIGDLGLAQSPATSTMSDGNRNRDSEVFKTIFTGLLKHYNGVLKGKSGRRVIEEVKDKTIKLVDSTTISVCLGLFNWAKFRTAKGGIKIHTCWSDQLMLPEVINITEAKVHDRNGLPEMIYAAQTIIVEDRGYFDFSLMRARIDAKNTFVTRIKVNTGYKTIEEKELPKDKDQQHIIKDEIIQLTGLKAQQAGMESHKLRLVHVYKSDEDKTIEIVTNNLDWAARTIADLYKKRWDIELFFKAMKQNLQIKTFVGTSENAVKSQIYIAMISYLLLELIRRNTSKTKQAFSNFVEKIRITLCFYLTLDYVVNQIKGGAIKIGKPVQTQLFEALDLFSQNQQNDP